MKPPIQLQLMLLAPLLLLLLRLGSSSACDLPDLPDEDQLSDAAVAPSSPPASRGELRLTYVRLTIECAPPADDDEDLRDGAVATVPPLFASLQPARPAGQAWPPPTEALAANARFALGVLHGLLPMPGRLRRLSLGGLQLGSLTQLVPALLKFQGLTRLNLTAVGTSFLPADLLQLPRLRRLDAGGNPLDCGRPENRWADLLTRLNSSLLSPAQLLACPWDGNASLGNDTEAAAAAAASIDADAEPASHEVDLSGVFRLPCSGRYFRPADAGLWSPDARAVWRRLDPGLSLRLPPGNDSAGVASYRPSGLHFVSRLAVGPVAEGAPLLVSGMRRAVAGLWGCELAKGGLLVVARHRLVLRPPLSGVEFACFAVAAATSVAMVLIGLAAALLRGMVRTRCCTRVVHIIEAQSVLNLDASPLQTRRRRQAATATAAPASSSACWPPRAAAAASASRGYWDVDEAADMIGAHPPSSLVASHQAGDGDLAGPSGAAGWRDRLRDMNDQMRLHVASFGESVGSTVRAGWSSSVEHMKEQMRSVAEFCGTNAPLGQTVSVVSVYTDPEGRQEPLEQHLHLLSSV